MVVHPNDKSDLAFTDPCYGAISIYEGKLANTDCSRPDQEEAVYRLDAQTATARSRDEPSQAEPARFSRLQKAMSATRASRTIAGGKRGWCESYDLDGSKLSNPEAVIDMKLRQVGLPDGMRVDTPAPTLGRAPGWVARAMTACRCRIDRRRRIGSAPVPETCANLCSAAKAQPLFIDPTSLYSVYVEAQCAHFRECHEGEWRIELFATPCNPYPQTREMAVDRS